MKAEEQPIISRDVYTLVTERIIKHLEAGTVPWKRPWREGTGLPKNFITKRPYRGVNFLLLASLNYPFNEFLTFRQATDLGGRIKKGEKAHLITYWIWHEEQRATKGTDVINKTVPTLRYYHVFNVQQCSNLPAEIDPVQIGVTTGIEKCEAIIAKMPQRPKILHNEDSAYYLPAADFVNMPKKEAFVSLESYYATLFHELVHSTGHEDRLNRKELMAQGGPETREYAIEELTAEIGSSYLASYAGIPVNDLKDAASYIQFWLARLQSDKRFILYASANAQNATDYILNIRHDENDLVSTFENDGV